MLTCKDYVKGITPILPSWLQKLAGKTLVDITSEKRALAFGRKNFMRHLSPQEYGICTELLKKSTQEYEITQKNWNCG